MKIIMIEQYSGSRYDGRMWPPAGTEFEVPDDEGKALIAHGVAKGVQSPKAAAAKVKVAGVDEIGQDDPPPADAPARARTARSSLS